jgi:hypothetical protein
VRTRDRRRRGHGRGSAAGRLGGAHHRHQPRASPGGRGADLPGAAARRAGRGGRGPLAPTARSGCSSSDRARAGRMSPRIGTVQR